MTPKKTKIPVSLTVLGCGSSSGTPLIGCRCEVCLSDNPKNKRLRTSAWVQVGDVSLMIDTGTDFRTQALRAGIAQLDAVLYTHPHADHLNGIDDLRALCYHKKGAIPVYGNAFTIDNITSRFDYAFLPVSKNWERPVLQAHVVHKAFQIKRVKITPVSVTHGRWVCCDYRIGDIAWLTDLNVIDQKELKKLRGLDYLFLDCLRMESYPTHLGWTQAIELAKTIGAKKTYLIHMTHNMEYEQMMQQCPDGIELAFDGLQVFSGGEDSLLPV